MNSSSSSPPELVTRWFYSTDSPKYDSSNPQKVIENRKPPVLWKSFAPIDSENIEILYEKYKRDKSEGKLVQPDPSTRDNPCTSPYSTMAGEDHLYEIDVASFEIRPIYWRGNVFEIRQGKWFTASSSGGYIPCDENLARQIEDGYRKFKPWLDNISVPTPSASKLAAVDSLSTSDKGEQKWHLFGPYKNSFAVYSGSHLATVKSINMLSVGSTRYIRGWDKLILLIKKAKVTQSKNATSTSKDNVAIEMQNLETVVGQGEQPPDSSWVELDQDVENPERQIDHLVFVIHGIGQKLSERMDQATFVHDVNLMRQNMKEVSKQLSKDTSNIPELGGVQVLPVLWRQKVKFETGAEKKKSEKSPPVSAPSTSSKPEEESRSRSLHIDDITLQGVPSIRNLVSDVILDVLLYLTPKYRREMLLQAAQEMNRMFSIYKRMNPNFSGSVSLYGHSLGSLLSYDICCNQSSGSSGFDRKVPATVSETGPPITLLGSPRMRSEVDLTDVLGGRPPLDQISGLLQIYDDPIPMQCKLDFAVDKLFAVGSPLGLFLMLRGEKIEMAELDSCITTKGLRVNSFYNIFHPNDPVAYRVEPLLDVQLSAVKPYPLPYTKGGIKGTIVGIQEYFSRSMMMDAVATGVLGSYYGWSGGPKNTSTAPAPTPTPPPGPAPASQQNSPERNAGSSNSLNNSGTANINNAPNTTSTQLADQPEKKAGAMLERLNPSKNRLDFSMQEGVLENPYLSAFSVHMQYWADIDCTKFIIKELHYQPNS